MSAMYTSHTPYNSNDPEIRRLCDWTEAALITCRATSRTEDPIDTATQSFIPCSDIDAYFATASVPRLLAALLPNDHIPSPKDVVEKCKLSLSILVRLGLGHHITHFLEHRTLWDSNLPFYTEPANFPRLHEFHALPQLSFFQRFQEAQWSFCACKLERLDKTVFAADEVFPFLEKEQLDRGGSSKLYKVEVHHAHDLLDGINNRPDSHRCFALKTYQGKKADEYFRQEVRSFHILSKTTQGARSNIIGFYGGFIHGDVYSILLEYANEGTLEQYLEKQNVPSSGQDLLELWGSWIGLVKGLACIHQPERDPNDQLGFKALQGWHQDIKPQNILICRPKGATKLSPYQWTFKVGDLGLSHFEAVTSEEADVAMMNPRGTSTYGAPEVHRRSSFDETTDRPATRAIDIWSLACVMLEVCIWSVRGKRYLDGFRDSRYEENRQSGSSAGDCFHDGKLPEPQTLHTVVQQLKTLPLERRVTDFVTIGVLAIIKSMMPAGGAGARPSALHVLNRLETTTEEARESLQEHNRRQRRTHTDVSNFLNDTKQEDAASDDIFGISMSTTAPIDDGRWTRTVSVGDPARLQNWLPDNRQYISPRPTGFAEGIDARVGKVPPNSRHAVDSIDTIQTFNPIEEDESPQSRYGYESPERRQDVLARVDSHSRRLQSRTMTDQKSFPAPDQGTGELGRRTSQRGRQDYPVQEMSGPAFGVPIRAPVRGHTTATTPADFARKGPNSYRGDLYTNTAFNADGGERRVPTHRNTISARELQQARTQDSRPGPTQLVGGMSHSSPEAPQSVLAQSPELMHSPKSPDQHDQIDASPAQASASTRAQSATPTPQGTRTAPPMPYLKIGQALEYFEKDSGLRGFAARKLGLIKLDDEYLRNRLKQRDHVILVDNSGAMSEHWLNVSDVHKVLCHFTIPADDDGIEIVFASNGQPVTYRKNVKKAVEAVTMQRPRSGQDHTNLCMALDTVLSQYHQKLLGERSSGKRVRPINVYVLTDGCWPNEQIARRSIKTLMEGMRAKGKSREHVGIQFIRFGNDPTGKTRLDNLDNLGKTEELKHLNLDIVDTEHFNGNVWKMLFGATDPYYDDDD